MIAAKIFLLLVFISTTQARPYSGNCRCYPERFSGTNYHAGGVFRNKLNADFGRKLIFDDFDNGTTILHDFGAEKISYIFENGACRKTSMSQNMRELIQCAPLNADYQLVILPNGERISSFEFFHEGSFYSKWMYEDKNCFPYGEYAWTVEGSNQKFSMMFYQQDINTKVDDSVFDIDTSSCT